MQNCTVSFGTYKAVFREVGEIFHQIDYHSFAFRKTGIQFFNAKKEMLLSIGDRTTLEAFITHLQLGWQISVPARGVVIKGPIKQRIKYIYSLDRCDRCGSEMIGVIANKHDERPIGYHCPNCNKDYFLTKEEAEPNTFGEG